MSELKAFELKVGKNLEIDSPLVVGVDDRRNSMVMSCEKVYLKSEADKVIKELEADCKEACDRLQTANLIKDEQLAATRHQKYKRCLAMAKICENKLGTVVKPVWWDKWRRRWLELAEKFKEAK